MHKVSMAKKRKSMSAPAPAKRVVSTGPAKIILPEMPALPTNVVTPTSITGIGGVGVGFGAGNGGNGNGDGGGGGFMGNFGSKTPRSGSLVGQYYDFKFTRSGSPNKDYKYAEEILSFVKGGWHESKFSKYYKGPSKLYATQIFFPEIDTSEGPKAFGNTIENNEGGKWIAIYRGMVAPPESGTYYFVGAGDDDMIVNFDGKEILNNCEHIDKDVDPTGEWNYEGLRNKFAKSQPVQVNAGQFYEIRILIGDDIPTKTMAMLLVMKDGVNYGGGGSPVIPVFSSVRECSHGRPAWRTSMAHCLERQAFLHINAGCIGPAVIPAKDWQSCAWRQAWIVPQNTFRIL